jgi:hypothetical protein
MRASASSTNALMLTPRSAAYPCTTDTCTPDGICAVETIPDDSACDPGFDCAGPGTCQAGVCQLSNHLCGLAQSPWPKPGHDNRQTNRSSHSPAGTVSALWTAALDLWVASEPLLDEAGTVFILTHSKSYAVGPDGTPKWDAAGDAPFAAVRADGTSFNTLGTNQVSKTSPKLYALDDQGKDLWSFSPVLTYQEVSLAIADDGTIYVGGALGASLTRGATFSNARTSSSIAADDVDVLVSAPTTADPRGEVDGGRHPQTVRFGGGIAPTSHQCLTGRTTTIHPIASTTC